MEENVFYGSRGPKVQQLQELLNQNLEPPRLLVDGIFGAKTLAAVRRFQGSSGKQPDGIVGPETWANLKKRCVTHYQPGKDVTVPEEATNAPWMAIAFGPRMKPRGVHLCQLVPGKSRDRGDKVCRSKKRKLLVAAVRWPNSN